MMRARGAGLMLACMCLASCTQVWRWEDEGKAKARPTSFSSRAATPVSGARQYTVKAGDTLYSICRVHELNYRDVAAWNGIGSDYRLEIGQVLRLTPPGSKIAGASKKPREALPAARPSSRASIAPREKPDSSTAALERYYSWQWPLRGAIAKTYEPEGGSKGLDIGGELGQAVIAAAPGRVVYSGSGLKGYGELVIIKHDETYLSAYGYNRKRLVEEGDLVIAGQAIAELGMGPEQKPLLHFEIREHGRPLDPLPLLPGMPKD
jgi:lipoprotein NlpD